MATSSALKSITAPLGKVVKVLTPTGIGVLVSLGAHVFLFVNGPGTNFSLAALDEAAQQEAEETIVPVIELTPAERSRLPGFAQPRTIVPTPTGLGTNFPLPPSIGSLNNRLNNQLNARKPSAANPLPSPTTTLPRSTRTNRIVRGTGLSPSALANRRATGAARRPVPTVTVIENIPQTSRSGLPIAEPSISVSGEVGTPNSPSTSTATESTTGSSNGSQQPRVSTNPLDQALARLEQQNGNSTTSSGGEPAVTPEGSEPVTATPIEVEEPDAIAIAPAQGNPNQLRDAFRYDPTDVEPEAGEANLDEWLIASAENKSGLSRANEEITIDSNFKVCVDNPPVNGIIGVIVNPDGSQEAAQVLKSIGYDILNRQALDAVSYADFGQVETATQYEISIEVIYSPDGCVEGIPETVE
ncbi:MAG: energy transducer TonB [Cyanobacteria bacterium P01_C01_bin.69]